MDGASKDPAFQQCVTFKSHILIAPRFPHLVDEFDRQFLV